MCYCDGKCQDKTGRGLEPVRDRTMISAKHGILLEGESKDVPATTADNYRREILENQLPRLRTDHVEWLQVGWFTANKIDALCASGGALEGIRQLQKEGIGIVIISHFGDVILDLVDEVIVLRSGRIDKITSREDFFMVCDYSEYLSTPDLLAYQIENLGNVKYLSEAEFLRNKDERI